MFRGPWKSLDRPLRKYWRLLRDLRGCIEVGKALEDVKDSSRKEMRDLLGSLSVCVGFWGLLEE